jgi:hypothetical protein
MCHAGGKKSKPPYSHWKECGVVTAYFLIWFWGYDGCAHCWKERNGK